MCANKKICTLFFKSRTEWEINNLIESRLLKVSKTVRFEEDVQEDGCDEDGPSNK